MSSPRGQVAGAIVGAAALALAGCNGTGLHPLYGRVNGTSPVATALASVDVETVEGRVGQELRNELTFLTASGGSAPPQYKLKIKLTETTESAVVNPFSSFPEIATIQIDAAYSMTKNGVAEPVLKTHGFATASYQNSLQRFADVRALRDAEDRAAKILADQIKTRLAAYFATQH
jgi:LPS-assembly lipoprotein